MLGPDELLQDNHLLFLDSDATRPIPRSRNCAGYTKETIACGRSGFNVG
jgi:hypothetical protein